MNPPPAPPVAEPASTVRRVLAGLADGGSRPVLTAPDRTTTTSAELAVAVLDAAAGLARLDVGPGRAVAVLTAPNSVATLVSRYAAHLVGAPVVHVRSVNPRTDATQLDRLHQAELLRQTSAGVLVVDAAHLGRGRELTAGPGGPLLAALEPLADDVLGLRPPGTGAGTGAVPRTVPAPDDVAVIGTTSGTTGAPKATRHTFGAWDRTVRSFPATGQDGQPCVLLVVTPLSHTVAPMVDAVLAAGGRVVLCERFDAEQVWRTVREERVTDTYVAVPHLHQLVDVAARSQVDASSLRRLIYSGSPASPRRVAEAREHLGDALVQLYGTTEAGGIADLTPLDHAEPELLGTVGRPFPWVRVELRDAGSGAVVPRGETGEVWVRTPTAMAGYLTAQDTRDQDGPDVSGRLRDGWLCTGDLGCWDRYGYLRLVGRSGDVIKSGGVKVHPAAVEQALLAHPDVAAAAAFAAPGPDDVETVHAAVVLRSGATCSAEQVRRSVTVRLDGPHTPAALLLLDALPLTPAGKPDRAALRAAVRSTTRRPGNRTGSAAAGPPASGTRPTAPAVATSGGLR